MFKKSISGTSTICSVSHENIIAFTSLTDLDDNCGETWGCHVYVIDMNAPWHKYKVASTVQLITVLEWDNDGKYLMVCTTDGEIAIHTTKQWLLSEWYCAYRGSLSGEHIIKGCFFHTGRRIVPCPDKKLDLPCTERYTHVKTSPTFEGFGGVPLEGACVVTITGLVGVFQIDSLTCQSSTGDYRPLSLTISTESLCHRRQFVRAADVAYTSNGQLVISWWCNGRVRCASVSVAQSKSDMSDKPQVHLQPVNSFFLSQDNVDCTIEASSVMLRWKNHEESDTLFVAHDQTLELWSLREITVPLHPLFAKGFPVPGSTTPGGVSQKPSVESVNTVKWRLLQVYSWPNGVVRGLATSRNHIVVATTESIAYLLDIDTLELINTTTVSCKHFPDAAYLESTPSKQTKYDSIESQNASEICCCITPLGGAVVALDSQSQLFLYSLPHPAADLASPTWAQTACGILEYSIISGIDCLDILLALPVNAIDTLYERLTDWFPRQPPAFQQYYHMSWLCLCAALSRLCPNGLSRSIDLMVQVMLHTIANSFKSLHRPTDGYDKSDSATDELEPDKITLDMSVEPVHNIRLAIQRIIDAGLRALARDTFTNSSVLRETITMCRSFLGGRGGATADTLSAIFRLISRDHSNSEEVLALLSQTGLTKGADDPPMYGIALSHSAKRPYILEYGVEPEILKTPQEQLALENVNITDTPMDTIRYWCIGGRGSRQGCARCGARGLRDQRHKMHCRCGGRWSVQAVA